MTPEKPDCWGGFQCGIASSRTGYTRRRENDAQLSKLAAVCNNSGIHVVENDVGPTTLPYVCMTFELIQLVR